MVFVLKLGQVRPVSPRALLRARQFSLPLVLTRRNWMAV